MSGFVGTRIYALARAHIHRAGPITPQKLALIRCHSPLSPAASLIVAVSLNGLAWGHGGPETPVDSLTAFSSPSSFPSLSTPLMLLYLCLSVLSVLLDINYLRCRFYSFSSPTHPPSLYHGALCWKPFDRLTPDGGCASLKLHNQMLVVSMAESRWHLFAMLCLG